MSNPDTPNVVKVNAPAGLTIETLMQMFLEQSKENAKANEKLAEALLESRKPYVDPRLVAEMEQRRKDRTALVNQELRTRTMAKKSCPHVNEGGKMNIKWMQHSNNIILGVCGSCRSEFDATHNREDAMLLRNDPKSIRNMGRAGDHAKRGLDIAL